VSGGNLQFNVCKQRTSWFSSTYLGKCHITPLISHPPPPRAQKTPWSGPPHYRGFTITLRQNTFGRTRLDKLSVRRSSLYLTTLTWGRHLCPHRNSNPQSQQASGSRSFGHRDRPSLSYDREVSFQNLSNPSFSSTGMHKSRTPVARTNTFSQSSVWPCLMSPFWLLESWDCSHIFGNLWTHALRFVPMEGT